MGTFLLRRAAISVVLLWLVLTVTFLAFELAPGDVADRFDNPRAPREAIDRLRALYGLDLPLGARYGTWLKAVATGDLGLSIHFQQPVRSVLLEHLPPTLLLGACGLSLGLGVGVVLGLFGARWAGPRTDRTLQTLTLISYSMPTFWVGMMALLIFSSTLGWLPHSGMRAPLADQWSLWRRWLDLGAHLLLPTATLALPIATQVSRLLRSRLLEEAGRTYVVAARARGLPERSVALHVLRNAGAPIAQLLGSWLPILGSGALVIEVLFSWPGLGQVATQAIQARDLPLALGVTILGSTAVLLGTLLADILHALLDPRVSTR